MTDTIAKLESVARLALLKRHAEPGLAASVMEQLGQRLERIGAEIRPCEPSEAAARITALTLVMFEQIIELQLELAIERRQTAWALPVVGEA